MKPKAQQCLLSLAAILFSQITFSQQQGLEEVIVTAEKRATNVQNTPLAVTAFTGEELDRALISKSLDLQFSVPNMLMSKGNFSGAQISIRGIGNLAVGSASDSGTGNHFDGVYLNNGRIFEMEFYDAERIEVLRGPQGTLFGRNTIGGAINIVSKTPSDELEGSVRVSMGDEGFWEVNSTVNVPFSDRAAGRFSFFKRERDGYVDALQYDNLELGN